jgi:hypothetical protein
VDCLLAYFLGAFEVARHDTGRPREVRTVQFEEAVLDTFENNPSTSTRVVGRAMHAPHATVWRVLNEQLLHPFHLQKVHALGPADYPARIQFAQYFLQQCDADPDYPLTVLFTDEAMFTREVLVNSHNMHQWAEDNPHATLQHGHQQRFSLNVWCGMVQSQLLGPHVFPGTLNGNIYEAFLRETLPDMLEDFPLAQRQHMVYMHDGAPPHFSIVARRQLDTAFPNRWIGRGGPFPWPPRSPDLNPLDYFLWGHLKTVVYETPVENVMVLRERVTAACQTIRDNPGMLRRACFSLRRRCQLCIEVGGRHFEQLL